MPGHEALTRRLGWPMQPFRARDNASLLGFLSRVRAAVRGAVGFLA